MAKNWSESERDHARARLTELEQAWRMSATKRAIADFDARQDPVG